MALASRECAVFMIDCSESMRDTIDFVEGTGDEQRTITTTPLDLMIRYVKAKIAQRIMRDLATTPCAVISFPVHKTKNILTHQLKDKAGADYEGEDDPYRHFYETVSFDYTPNAKMINAVTELKTIKTGSSPADLHSALILGLETIDNQPKASKYKKDIYILTNGEAKTDWTRWEDTQSRLIEKGVSVVIVGMGFDDEEAGEFEQNKSKTKRENEKILRELVEGLELPGRVATVSSALEAIAEPNVKETKSMSTATTLSFGNRELFPDTSLTMFVDIKKAITAASVKSMQQMSMRHFERTATTQRPANADPSQTQSQSGDQSHKPIIGRLFERMLLDSGLTLMDEPDSDLLLHKVLRESMNYYRPSDDPIDKGPGATQGTATEQEENDGEEDKVRWTGERELAEAYYYGGDPVTIGDDPSVGKLKGNKTSMEIIGFIRQSSVRFEWRMNDLLYVYGGRGQLGSQQMLSALINAMEEKQCAAIVRWVGKGMNRKEVFTLPDPKVGLLWPMRGTSDDGDPVEYCLWSQLPFAEDVRNLNFPSLSNLYNRKNVPVTVHKNLPTAEMDEAMGAFVDSMDLVMKDEEDLKVKGEEDEEEIETEVPPSWFSVQDSFSPAIHNIQNTLVFRLSDPDGELPPPPTTLTKYLDPPSFVVERAEEAKAAAIKAFNVTRVPPKPKKLGKKVQNFATGNEKQIDIDELFGSTPLPQASTSTAHIPTAAKKLLALPPQSQSKPTNADKHSAMDIDDDEAGAVTKTVPPTSMDVDEDEDPPTEDEEPPTDDDEDMDLAPAKIDEKDPLRDFDKIVRSRGEVSATTEMLGVVEKLLKSSFLTANYDLAAECLGATRKACAEYPATYNYGIRGLVKTLQSDPKKKDFVEWIKQKELGLITSGQGGASQTDASTFFANL